MNFLDLPVDVFVSITKPINIGNIFKSLLLIELYEKKHNIKICYEYFKTNMVSEISFFDINSDRERYVYFKQCDSVINNVNICEPELFMRRNIINRNFSYMIMLNKASAYFSYKGIIGLDDNSYPDITYLKVNGLNRVNKSLIDELDIFPNLSKLKIKFIDIYNKDFCLKIANNNKITDIKICYNIMHNLYYSENLDILKAKNIYFKIFVKNNELKWNNVQKIYNLCREYNNINLSIRFTDEGTIYDIIKPFINKITYRLRFTNELITINSYVKCKQIKFKTYERYSVWQPEYTLRISNCPELIMIHIELFSDNIILYLENVPNLSVINHYTNIIIVYGDNVNRDIIVNKINKINILNFEALD